MYKILAKVLVSRLRMVLPSIISQSHGAFIHGRQILCGVLITNECIRSKFRGKVLVLCKLELEKAYDRVDWGFLSYMLRRMGFESKWRWIQECHLRDSP